MAAEMDKALCARVSPRGRGVAITTAIKAAAGMGVVSACGFSSGVGGPGGAVGCVGSRFDGGFIDDIMGEILHSLLV